MFIAMACVSHACATETIRVACLGDSITKGARAKPTESYPAQLQQILGEAYKVENFGIGGATLLKSGQPNVWQALDDTKKFTPNVVVIAVGVNTRSPVRGRTGRRSIASITTIKS